MLRRLKCLAVFVFICSAAGAAENAAEKGANPDLSPAAIQQRIQQHRTAEVSLTVLGADGKALANAPVVIRQTRHKFLFGCNAFGLRGPDSEMQQLYRKRFAELMNFATLPFYLGSFEPAQGQPQTEKVGAMAEWCAANNIHTKGHPLCWHQGVPRWIQDKSPEDVLAIYLSRITRDVTNFKGMINTWDVVNEAVVMPNYNRAESPTPLPALAKKIGAVELIKQCFERARKANPDAALILNDYDTSPKYEKLIQDCLGAGVSIDVIGIQSHQHRAYWGAERLWDVLTRFSKFNRPIHFTETTIVSGPGPKQIRYLGARHDDWFSTPEGEAQQAKDVAEFYTILFSHPAVGAVTWWDFSDLGAWLGAPAGFLRKDMSPKPAYDALMKLVKNDWWTKEVKTTTDASGKVTFRGFLGDYALESSLGKAAFSVETAGKAEAKAAVR